MEAATSICDRARLQIEHRRNHGHKHPPTSPRLWSAHLAGGTHHAFHARGEGFCIFSDIAVAADVLLRTYPDIVQNVLVLDLDVHQGNGNAVLFQSRPEVFTFSLHCRDNYFSKKEVVGDLDVELPTNCNDATYLATLHHWLKRIQNKTRHHTYNSHNHRLKRQQPFDFIFFQAGVDILKEDRLGRMALTRDGVTRRNQMVFQFAADMDAPLCITMGGGYPSDDKDWTPILNAHTDVYVQALQFLARHS